MVMISSDNTAINTGVDTNSGQQAGKGAGGFALLMDLPQWEEWARHILKDLEMLHKSIDRLNKKLDILQQNKITFIEKDIAVLKTKFLLLGVVASSVVSGVVALIVGVIRG